HARRVRRIRRIVAYVAIKIGIGNKAKRVLAGPSARRWVVIAPAVELQACFVIELAACESVAGAEGRIALAVDIAEGIVVDAVLDSTCSIRDCTDRAEMVREIPGHIATGGNAGHKKLVKAVAEDASSCQRTAAVQVSPDVAHAGLGVIVGKLL